MKSERGNSNVLFALLAVFVLGLAFMGIASSLPGMKAGADTIGNAAGDAIDNTTHDQDLENMVWIAQNATAFWVNQQKLFPNKHSIERHGADAWAATTCYNNNGTFQIWRVGNDEFHMLCKDIDGSIFDIILRRWSNTSKDFDFTSCFRKEKGLRDALRWLAGKRATNASLPEGITIYIDGVVP
jgi:hypothetical protein